MKKTNILSFLMSLALIFTSMLAGGQQNLAEKLGYDADAKLLIVHADDIGLAQSVNEATNAAFASGGISSGEPSRFGETMSTRPSATVHLPHRRRARSARARTANPRSRKPSPIGRMLLFSPR